MLGKNASFLTTNRFITILLMKPCSVLNRNPKISNFQIDAHFILPTRDYKMIYNLSKSILM